MTAALLVTQVVLWHAYQGAEARAIKQLAAQYQAAHPDVAIDVVPIPYNAYTEKLEAAIPLGNGPDLFIAAHESLGEWSRLGLVAPQPRSATPIPPAIERALTTTGGLYGLPLAKKGAALIYRRDRLATPPTNGTALLALRRSGSPPLAYETGSLYLHAAWLAASGGAILDEHDQPQLGAPAFVRSLEWLKLLQDQRLIPEDLSGADATQLFLQGKADLLIAGPWVLDDLAGLPIAVAPIPALGHAARPLLTIEVIVLSARATEPTAAGAFAEYLQSREGARVRAQVGRQIVADDEIVKELDDPLLRQFALALAAGEPMSTARAMKLVWEPGQRALRRVLRGAAEPTIAARDAQLDVEDALRPPPPTQDARPYLVALSLALVGLVARAARRTRPPSRPGQRAAYLFAAPMQLVFVVLAGVPLLVGAAMAFFHYDARHWTFVGLFNLVDILRSSGVPPWSPPSFYYTLAVTILWTLANVTLHVAIGLGLALLLRNPARRLRGVYRILLILPWAMPNYITGLVWRGLFNRQFGALNALLVWLGGEPISFFARFWTAFAANLATNVWLGFPFMMVVILGALAQVPKEVEEAAALDGASGWQRLTRVTLPIIWPALLPSVILGAVWTFNMFNVIFLVSGGEPDGASEILVSQAYRWAFSRNHRYGYAAAYALLIAGVLVLQGWLVRRATQKEAA